MNSKDAALIGECRRLFYEQEGAPRPLYLPRDKYEQLKDAIERHNESQNALILYSDTECVRDSRGERTVLRYKREPREHFAFKGECCFPVDSNEPPDGNDAAARVATDAHAVADITAQE